MGWFDTQAAQAPSLGDPRVRTGGAPSTMPMPTAPGPQSGGSSSNIDPQQAFQEAVQTLGISPQQFRGNPQVMNQVTDYLNKKYPGMNWSNGGARAGDWVSVNGQGFDVLPAGDRNWQWLSDPANSTAGSSGGSIGSMSGATGQSPSDIIKATPGFQFRFDEGLNALQRSAAAKGDLLTGGTLKDITEFGQNFASNEFQNQWNRDMQLAQFGYGSAGNIGQFGSQYGQTMADAYGAKGSAAAAGSNAQGNIWGNVAGQVATGIGDWWKKRQASRSPTAPSPTGGGVPGQSSGGTGSDGEVGD